MAETSAQRRPAPGPPAPESTAVEPETHFCARGPSGVSLDGRGLALVYCASPPLLAASLRGAHATAQPVFYGAVPAAWGAAGLTQRTAVAAVAYRLTLTQGFAYGLIMGVKHAVGRPRPYVTRPLQARARRHPAPGRAQLSFPSGHAGLAAALVTSWGLSHPRWYVVGPGALWATGVALSRLYLGVHYPSDALAGAAIGAGVALLVHQLRRVLTPPRLQASAHPVRLRAPPLLLRLQF